MADILSRQQAIEIIDKVLWPLGTKVGKALVGEVIAEMGTDALSDTALARLAFKEQLLDNLTGTPNYRRRMAELRAEER